MARKLTLGDSHPDKLLLSQEVEVVVATSQEGEFAVLAGHVPLLASLAIGELRFRKAGQTDYAAVAGGFAEVTGEKVTILAEAAELARAIDIPRAQRARERAEARLAKAKAELIDHARAEVALKRAILRLRVANRLAGGSAV